MVNIRVSRPSSLMPSSTPPKRVVFPFRLSFAGAPDTASIPISRWHQGTVRRFYVKPLDAYGNTGRFLLAVRSLPPEDCWIFLLPPNSELGSSMQGSVNCTMHPFTLDVRSSIFLILRTPSPARPGRLILIPSWSHSTSFSLIHSSRRLGHFYSCLQVVSFPDFSSSLIGLQRETTPTSSPFLLPYSRSPYCLSLRHGLCSKHFLPPHLSLCCQYSSQ